MSRTEPGERAHAAYDTVGKRSWAVTDVRRLEANFAEKTVDDAYII